MSLDFKTAASKFMGPGQGGAGLAAASPWGAVAGAVTDIASTPNTSATGDVTTGGTTFGAVNTGGGFKLPREAWYALTAVGVVAAALIFRSK